MMLCRMAFQLSGKVFALHLDSCAAKSYLCNQCGKVSPFVSRLACQTLSLTDKHSITLIPGYILTHLNVEANYLSQGRFLEWQLLPHIAKLHFYFRVHKSWICLHPHISCGVSIITPLKIYHLQGHWG